MEENVDRIGTIYKMKRLDRKTIFLMAPCFMRLTLGR